MKHPPAPGLCCWFCSSDFDAPPVDPEIGMAAHDECVEHYAELGDPVACGMAGRRGLVTLDLESVEAGRRGGPAATKEVTV